MGQTPTFTLASMGGGDGGPRVIRGADATPQPSGETPMSARAIVPAPARGAGAAASRTSSSDPSRPDAVAFVVHRRPRPGTADDRDQQLYINDVWVAALPDGERVQVSLPARADNAYQVRLMLSNSPGGGDTHAIRAKPGEEVIVETDMKAGDGDPCRIVKDQLKVRPAGQADPGDPR